jgi:hypothetical protein
MTTASKTRALAGVAIGLLSLIGVVLSGVPAYADPTLDSDQPLSELTVAEIALINSGNPVVVTADVETGHFTSVEPVGAAPIQPAAVHNTCSTGQACWKPWTTPYKAYGFSGTGATGSWSHRGTFYSGNYFAKPCWLSPTSFRTVCSEIYIEKKSYITWGASLTGKRVYLATGPSA